MNFKKHLQKSRNLYYIMNMKKKILSIEVVLVISLCFPAMAQAAIGIDTKSKAMKETLGQLETSPSQHTSQTTTSLPQKQSSSEIEIAQENNSTQIKESDSRLAGASTTNPSIYYTSEGLFKKHTGQLGPEVSYIQYKEPGLIKETGMMYGLAGSYAYHENIMAKLEGRIAYGQVKYDGSGKIDDINDYIGEARGLVGYDFQICEASALTPYVGAGYRYLNDDLSGKVSTTGANGYDRESNYIYSPIGLEALVRFDNGWAVGASAEYDYFWWGKQISHLSDVNSAFNDPENRQKKGYGIQGSLRLLKKSEKINFLFEPFIRYWNIKQSRDAEETLNGAFNGYVYEPKNNSTEAGAKFAVEF
jgi:hypothetical protein